MDNALYAEIDRLKAENAVLTGDVDEWRRQWILMSAENAGLKRAVEDERSIREAEKKILLEEVAMNAKLKEENAELSREKHLLLDASK